MSRIRLFSAAASTLVLFAGADALTAQGSDPYCYNLGLIAYQNDMYNCEEFSSEDRADAAAILSLISQSCSSSITSALTSALQNDALFWFDSSNNTKGYHSGPGGLASEANRIYIDRDYWYGENEVEMLAHEGGIHHAGTSDEGIANFQGQNCQALATGGMPDIVLGTGGRD